MSMINPEKLFVAIAFTGFMTVYTGFWGEMNTVAIAANYNTITSKQIFSSSMATLNKSPIEPQIIQQITINKQTPTPAPTLPSETIDAIINDLQRRTGRDPSSFTITSFTRRQWPDGCLGIYKPDQVCTMAEIPGWRVVVSSNDSEDTWVYRAAIRGRRIRLEE